jgi:hypothetical protein
VDAKPVRRLKLVMSAAPPSTTTAASSSSNGGNAQSMQSPHRLVLRASADPSAGTTQLPGAALTGVDLLASLAARTGSDSDVDDAMEEEGGDLFQADVAVLRLPSGKRIRRHSIAY